MAQSAHAQTEQRGSIKLVSICLSVATKKFSHTHQHLKILRGDNNTEMQKTTMQKTTIHKNIFEITEAVGLPPFCMRGKTREHCAWQTSSATYSKSKCQTISH